MTLGYFLELFLGIEKLAVGDTNGKIGIDWWPTGADFLNDKIMILELTATQAEKIVELLVFKMDGDKWSFFHPRMMESDGNFLELTHARFLGKEDRMLIRVLRNGRHPELPMLTVNQLVEIARKRLTQ